MEDVEQKRKSRKLSPYTEKYKEQFAEHFELFRMMIRQLVYESWVGLRPAPFLFHGGFNGNV